MRSGNWAKAYGDIVKQFRWHEESKSLEGLHSAEESSAAFVEYFHLYDKPQLKRWHFLDRMSVAVKDLGDVQARGVGIGIARVSSEIPRDDLFNVGEWGRARAIVFETAQKLSQSLGVQDYLENVIRNASSYEFSADIIFFCKNKDRNHALTEWAHIDPEKP